MSNNSKNRFSSLLETDKDLSNNIFKKQKNIFFKKQESIRKFNEIEEKTGRFSNLKINEQIDNIFKNEGKNNCFKKRDKHNYRGRDDINRFSKRYYDSKKKEEKPKVYEYNIEDFPAL